MTRPWGPGRRPRNQPGCYRDGPGRGGWWPEPGSCAGGENQLDSKNSPVSATRVHAGTREIQLFGQTQALHLASENLHPVGRPIHHSLGNKPGEAWGCLVIWGYLWVFLNSERAASHMALSRWCCQLLSAWWVTMQHYLPLACLLPCGMLPVITYLFRAHATSLTLPFIPRGGGVFSAMFPVGTKAQRHEDPCSGSQRWVMAELGLEPRFA